MNLSICIRYSTPEDNVLEIGFYRGEALLYNVFYNVEGLSEDDLIKLKKKHVQSSVQYFLKYH